MARPLMIDGTSGLIEMTDTQLDSICYYLRVAYAAQVNASGDGYVALSGTGTSIGSSSDTSSTQQTASNPRNFSPGTDYPAAPGIGTETDATFSYTQDRTVPAFPSNAALDADGYLIIDGTSGIRVVNTEAQIFNEIVSQTITDMRTGDEVGTYRVGTTAPAGGTWVSKGAFFTDTTYSAGTTTYNLYLKTAGTPPAGFNPVQLDGASGVQEITGIWNETHPMIQNVILPCLTRRLSNGDLNYTVITTAATGIDRGAWTDTRQTTSSTSQSFTSPTYFTTSTPSGAATTITTYRLNLA